MKMTAYSCRPDEIEFFEKFSKTYQIQTELTSRPPGMDNAQLAAGSQAVCTITTPVGRELIDAWHRLGVKLISTRTVGFEHIDWAYAASLGIRVTNATYTPVTVAEYTVMTILMAIRRMKAIMTRYLGQDYSLLEIRGRELRNLTVGVVGTGRIGRQVIHMLQGFGCRILAYDKFPSQELEGAVYVDLDTIWKECDLITFHVPGGEETFHLVNQHTLSKMKDGVILINMARGSIICTKDLIEALDCGKVGAAALDVVENESKIYYKDFKYKPTGHHDMAVLAAMPNVLMTPHTAFFTDEAVSDMVECAMASAACLRDGREDEMAVNGL